VLLAAIYHASDLGPSDLFNACVVVTIAGLAGVALIYFVMEARRRGAEAAGTQATQPCGASQLV